MMIPSLRVDDRLTHGQIAMVWSKEFGTNRIVVANDRAVTDEVSNLTLRMATPGGIKLLIKTVDDAIKLFNNPKAQGVDMFVLTNNVADAVRIVKGCPGYVQSVNVANVGRFDLTPPSEKIVINGAITLNKDELAALKELATLDVKAFQQILPSDRKTPVSELLKGQ